MTPAKLWMLHKLRMENHERLALPVDKLAWLYSNMNRDPGNDNPDFGPLRPQAPVRDLDIFRTYYTSRRTLAAKDDTSPIILGANTDVESWKSWAKGRGKE